MATSILMQLVGYSNPGKRHLESHAMFIVVKILAENIGGDMIRGGIMLALLNVLVGRIVRVLWRNPDSVIYRCIKTPETQIKQPHMLNKKCSAQTK